MVFPCLFLTGIIGGGPNNGGTGGAFPRMVRVAIGATLLVAADVEREMESEAGTFCLARAANKTRDRGAWMEKLGGYSGKDFRRRFKVTRKRFESIAEKIKTEVEPSELGKVMDFRSSGSYVISEICLAVTSRWLASSHSLDLEDIYGVEANSVFGIIRRTVESLDEVLKLDPFDPWDVIQCGALAESMFIRSKQTVAKCIGALDGMCVRIYRPREREVGNPLHFLNRKGFFGINLQAICNAERKFIWFGMDAAGGTHDSLAFKLSELGSRLANQEFPDGFWFAGDDAYACTMSLLAPFLKQSQRGHKEKDNYNFYQSRCRINVECAFGILVARFGVLRRPMRNKVALIIVVVSVCMKYHDICIDGKMNFRLLCRMT